MLKRLQQHWDVGTKELILILCTFAITGSLTAWLTRQVAIWMQLEPYGVGWWASKIIMLIFGYQVIILLVGFCFGMFPFFWKYEKKILSRFGLMKKETGIDTPVAIAIFASGAGSNAQKIIDHFRDHPLAQVKLIVCNNPAAGVLGLAAAEGMPVLQIQKKHFTETGYVPELQQQDIGLIVLAGFLWLVPPVLVKAYEGRIINIHPALLPAYGGKGMYGMAVHRAVLAAGEKKSGITIHHVDEHYDNGSVILQATCEVSPADTPETLAQKVHQLEHAHYAAAIEQLIQQWPPTSENQSAIKEATAREALTIK